MAKKPPHSSANENPREKQPNNLTAKAITIFERTYAKENDANRQQEKTEHRWNKIIQIATLLFVIATTGGVFIQAYVLNSTDKIIRESMIGSQRAWVGTPEIKIEKVGNDFVKFTFLFKNVGRTPTHGLYIDGNLSAGDQINEMKRLCQEGETVAKRNPDFYLWSSIPDNIFPITWMPTRDFKKIELSTLRTMKDPAIAGCVIYGDRIDNSLHQTGFIAPIEISGNDVNVSYVWAISPN